jgi:hypothetical protein
LGKDRYSIDAFLALVRAGLWEQSVSLISYGDVDYEIVMNLAEEQAVEGLVTAGIEHVNDDNFPLEVKLQMIGLAVQNEQVNREMNIFIAKLFQYFKEKRIKAILVKGQGVALCYEKPLWRGSGDIDLLLDEEDYQRCKAYLTPKADSSEQEDTVRKHLALTIDDWIVELHGSLRSYQSSKVDEVVDSVQEACLKNGACRVWNNNGVDVLLPSPDNDVIIVFSHIIQHFYGGGIGLRQICDWCRLMWTYRDSLDLELLDNRLKKAGLVCEWRVFGALAVERLGMPSEALPLYVASHQYSKKAERLLSFIIKTGNFGHNRDHSFIEKYPTVIRHFLLFCLYTNDTVERFVIFPAGSIKAWIGWIRNGYRRAVLGRR